MRLWPLALLVAGCATVHDPALRRELLQRMREDQAIRSGPPSDAVVARMTAVDHDNTAWLKQIVSTRGWPGRSLVGDDGALAAFLLAQHADDDLAFQKVCLVKLEAAVKAGDAPAKNWAYLTDRVAVSENRKQVYGTQFNGDQPEPIEDEAHVDQRRKSVGLPSMAEYRKQLREAYGWPK